MLLYIMLYIVLAYLILFAALINAVCLYNASFFCHWFLQMLFIFMLCLCLLTHSLFISFFISIMHSAFNLFVFPNSMFTPLLLLFFYIWKGYELSGEIALKNNHYYYYIVCLFHFLFPSCTVLLICLFFLILCSHRCCCCFFIYERAMSSPEK